MTFAPPPFNWTGLYFGGNVGYGWARHESETSFEGPVAGGPTAIGIGAVDLSFTTANSSGDLKGLIAGAQVGFNWQAGIWVFGLELDGQWSGQQQSGAIECSTGLCTGSHDVRLRSLVTARARAGVAFDRVLAYGTVGGAWANLRDDLALTVNAVTANFLSISDTAFGWTAGAGVELAFWDNWSARLEFLHVNIKDFNAEAAIPGIIGAGVAIQSANFHDNIVRVGVNYRFGPGMSPHLPPPIYSAAPRGYLAGGVDAIAPAYVDAQPPTYRAAGVEGKRRADPERSVARVRTPRPAPPPSEASDLVDVEQTGSNIAEADLKPRSKELRDSETGELTRLHRIMQICRGC
jgi:outer membrane immunogenic protein